MGDIAASMQWYRDTLQFDADPLPPTPPHVFSIMSKRDVAIMLQLLDAYQEPGLYDKRDGGVWSVYFETENIQSLYDAVAKAR